ncbi:SprT family zinc-dependent metalloprotease [Acetobacteraceae bacterium ESL0709]|nr:SprT family zinc-dependent metalloprotease [Acetobacteraceae bacterium ESL0697]MDF7677328.1 SprT family zinc-dependent metalloprotease [Acetobacteraceae bacterium ESL0709]
MFLPPLIWKKNPRAKRLSLRVDPTQRAVVITLPSGASPEQGLAFFQTQSHWISKALSELPPRAIETGQLPLEGHIVRLLRDPNAKGGVWLDQDGIHISGQTEHHERRLKDFLKTLAIRRISPSVTFYSRRMQLSLTRLTFRDTKTRWGSCTKEGHLMLNWRLLLAPAAIRDYVIVHELAHLQHFHHGPSFWALVDRYCPQNIQGRKTAELWLKTNGSTLLSII